MATNEDPTTGPGQPDPTGGSTQEMMRLAPRRPPSDKESLQAAIAGQIAFAKASFPWSRELSLVVTKLDEASLWAERLEA